MDNELEKVQIALNTFQWVKIDPKVLKKANEVILAYLSK